MGLCGTTCMFNFGNIALTDTACAAQEASAEGDLGRTVSYTAAMCLLRGRAYAGLDNRARAIAWFRRALRADPFCYEAFQACLLLCCLSLA